MSDAQFWLMFASVFSILTGCVGWIIGWIKGLSNRIAKLEIEVAVLKALEGKN